MPSQTNRSKHIVLTGGPGSGKTTTLELLHRKGYVTGEDAARSLIRERKKQGLSARPDAITFAQLIFQREAKAYCRHTTVPIFYERGVVEAAGTLCALEAMDGHAASRFLERHPYDAVFIFPPWEEIYCTDEERDHTFEHAVNVYKTTKNLYQSFGYATTQVPPDTPENRVEFILNHLSL
ncbi:MAG: AAA family ATPase [Pseudomonadota bacterium]